MISGWFKTNTLEDPVALGCADTDEVLVTINALPTAVITGSTTICNGGNTDLTGTGGGTYVWDSGETTTIINVSPTSDKTYTGGF